MTRAITNPESTWIESSAAPKAGPPAVVHSFGRTDPGRVRTSNEDHFLVAELARTLRVHQTSLPQPQTQYSSNRSHLFLVADGMGGHQAGEVASALTVATIEEFVLNLLRRFSNVQAPEEPCVLTDFQKALPQADERLFEEAAHHPEFLGMGTTLTMGFTSNWKLFVVHAGDSRCYLFRAGKVGQLTTDHTLVGEMVREGILKPAEAAHHQFRHVVTNVVGGVEAGIRAEVQKVDLQPGDVILLCSDGLTEMLADERIAAVLHAEPDPQAACDRLVTEANEQGGRDNITVIVARFEAG